MDQRILNTTALIGLTLLNLGCQPAFEDDSVQPIDPNQTLSGSDSIAVECQLPGEQGTVVIRRMQDGTYIAQVKQTSFNPMTKFRGAYAHLNASASESTIRFENDDFELEIQRNANSSQPLTGRFTADVHGHREAGSALICRLL